ncbi:MAG: putative transrane protein of unknown function [Flavipsychrobacter sp.]|nr:putative transrane protein of unknown function [Flavipsychrobacter sp.]
MYTKKSALYYYFGSLLAFIGFLFFFMFFLFDVAGFGDVGMGRIIESVPTLVTVGILLLIAPIIATVICRSGERAIQLEYICRSMLRYIVAYLMFYYGYAKMRHKFFEITYMSQDTRLAEVDSFSLVWYFFGRSNVQEFMIGLMEFVPAILLFFRRTSFLGYILLFPVAMNVLIVNTFNHVSGITFPLSIFIVLANIYLLYGHKTAIIAFLKSITEPKGPALNKYLNGLRWFFKLAIAGTVGYIIFVTLIMPVFRKKPNYTQRNKFTGGFELTELRVNDSIIRPDTGNTMYYKKIYIEPQSRWNSVVTYATTFHPKAMTIKWNKQNDSVYTMLKKQNDVIRDAVDSATTFIGTYRLKGDTLLIDGTQYGSTIHAKYHKKDLQDYKWFW